MKTYGIIAAMDEEHDAILNIMTDNTKETIYNLNFVIGKINNTKCILTKSGVGKVNAGRVTQLLIDKYDVDAVINVGSAGAVHTELDYGDIVISKACVQHDFDITCFDHPKGYITDIGVEIKADENLINVFKNAIHKLDSSIKIVEGIIATGDQFYTQADIKLGIAKEFNAECEDMEGAAIAQVSMLCNKPFVVIRSISDTPKSDAKIDFYEYLELASKRCAQMLKIALE